MPLVPGGPTIAQFALRWMLDHVGVTVVMPSARNRGQAEGNAAAAHLSPFTADKLAGVRDVYDRLIRPYVHDRW